MKYKNAKTAIIAGENDLFKCGNDTLSSYGNKPGFTEPPFKMYILSSWTDREKR